VKTLVLLLALTLGCAMVTVHTVPPKDFAVGRPKFVTPVLAYDPTAEGRRVAVLRLTGELEPPQATAVETAISRTAGADAIVVEIDSPGGSVLAARTIALAILDAPAPVTCVVTHLAASAAFLILQTCRLRVMVYDAQLMLHEAYSAKQPQSVTEAIEQALDLAEINAKLAAVSCGRMNISLDQCRGNIDGQDWWMGAQDAQEVGAIDMVVPSAQFVEEALRFPADKEP
jgi:ATP-dependent protease ClpP protease subunit